MNIRKKRGASLSLKLSARLLLPGLVEELDFSCRLKIDFAYQNACIWGKASPLSQTVSLSTVYLILLKSWLTSCSLKISFATKMLASKATLRRSLSLISNCFTVFSIFQYEYIKMKTDLIWYSRSHFDNTLLWMVWGTLAVQEKQFPSFRNQVLIIDLQWQC